MPASLAAIGETLRARLDGPWNQPEDPSEPEPMLTFFRDLLDLKRVRELPMSGGQCRMYQLAGGDNLIKVIVRSAVPAQALPGGIQGAAELRYFTITVATSHS
jgi:hypothetical protein